MSGQSHRPPRFARAVLAFAFHADDRPFALADLDEEFAERAARDGAWRGAWWYRRQVLVSLIPAVRGRFVQRSSRRAGLRETGPVGDLVSDLRFGARVMRRTPLVTALTVLSLGVGLGGIALVLALIDGTILQPPIGLAAPEEIVSLYRTDESGHPYGSVSQADYRDVGDEVDGLSGVAAVALRPASLSRSGPASSVLIEAVSPNFFEVTGMVPRLGRAFSATDLAAGRDTRLAVLGYDAWHEHFGGDEGVIGASVQVDGVTFTVVGVAPDGVRSRNVPLEPSLWIPLGSLQPSGRLSEASSVDRGTRGLRLLGRMRPGATIESVQAQADVLAARLAVDAPDAWAPAGGDGQRFTVVSESRSRTNPRAGVALMTAAGFLLMVAGMILLLACANVAGLFVARAERRRGEMAVRASMGASRARIVRMLLAEGIWPGGLGALLGVGLSAWSMRALATATLPVELPLRLELRLSPMVLAGTVGVALLATFAFSLLPALGSARTDVASALRGRGGGGRTGKGAVRNGLVVVQCATSAVLLIGATLFVRTLSVATTADLGFDHRDVAVATHRLPVGMSVAEGGAELDALRTRLEGIDGIEEVAMSSVLELTLFQTLEPLPLSIRGYESSTDGQELVFHNAVSAGYLEMLAVPMLSGRTIEPGDGPGDERVAVVNRSFADRYWPGLDPIGRTFEAGPAADATTYRVVGVARDGKYQDFDDPPTPYFFSALRQDHQAEVAVLVKGAGRAHDLLPTLRREVASEDGVVQLVPPSVLSDQVSVQFLHLRILSGLLGWAGLFGLFLATIGIYGVVAFAVSQRAREMAIRVALGADTGRVVRSVAMDGVRLAIVGLTVGVLVAIPAAGLLRALLFGVSPADPRALGASLTLLLVVSVGASVLPARRITRVDPMVTLRSE